MKYILLLLLALPSVALAQYNQSVAYAMPAQSPAFTEPVSPIIVGQNTRGSYREPMPHGFRMMQAGKTLTAIGGVLLVTGIILVSDSDKETHYVYNSNTGYYDEAVDGKLVAGALCIVGSFGLTIPGVILWARGSHKFNRYLESQSVNPAARIRVKNRGLSLTYTF